MNNQPLPSRKDAEQISLDAFLARPRHIDAVKLERALKQSRSDEGNLGGRTRLRCRLAGNCNTNFLEPALAVTLSAEGFAPDITSADFDGWIQAAIEGETPTDWWIVWLSSMGLTRGGAQRPELDVAAWRTAKAAILARGESLLVVPPEPLEWEEDPFSPFTAWRRHALQLIEDAFAPESVILPVENVQRRVGQALWHAPRYWTTAKIACHPDAVAAVGVTLGRTVARAIRPRVKAIVVDLDNTLWGGVVGDDGPEGLELDSNGEGRPFLDMQRFLLDLSGTGVPISVASKNDLEQASRPFKERPEMILKREDFVYFHASWNSKREAIEAIARDLNLGLDAICFLDDSPHERHEARTYLPELVVPELPDDPEERVSFLLRSGLFGTPIMRTEDRQRAKMYREEAGRQEALREAPDKATYLKSLDMRLRVERISAKNLPRAESLIQKTNQFNVTGRRNTGPRLMELAQDEAGYAYCASLRDRFGDSGIIGVLIARRGDGKAIIEDWVLSCRAFGRQVEDAMFDHLVAWAQGRGCENIETEFMLTRKNGLVPDILRRLEFEPTLDSVTGHWACRSPKRPSHAIMLETG